MAGRTTTPIQVVPRDAFGHDADKALSALRLALGAVLRALPAEARSAAELAKLLGLNRKIAWQVWRIADAEERSPLQVLPGPVALEGFLLACAGEGVSVELLDEARAAIRRFDDLAELHGGDRASLMTLLRQSRGGRGEGAEWGEPGHEGLAAAERAAESVRRRAYQANGEIWGIQTRAYFASAILAPGSMPGRLDDLSLAGEMGVRRLRTEAVRVISGMGFYSAKARKADAAQFPARPLVEVDPATGLIEPMLPRFTSARVRAIASEPDAGQTRVELVESPVGLRGEVDFVLGQHCANVGQQFATERMKRVHFSVHLYSAYSVCVHDLLVHRDLWAPGTIAPVSRVYSGLRGMMTSQASRDERDILPIRLEVKRLGAGLSALKNAHVPNYLEIVDWACERVGWKPEQFEAYRCVLMYPPMPCTLVMGVELPGVE
ncbi:MAG: hypothetical protein IT438_04800 [Phycisphaerales bacterium]|nr:hypothetical protein [Phycisphaerales bacterium]